MAWSWWRTSGTSLSRSIFLISGEAEGGQGSGFADLHPAQEVELVGEKEPDRETDQKEEQEETLQLGRAQKL